MNNTTSEEIPPNECDLPSWFEETTNVVSFAGYLVVTPIHTAISVPGFLFTLLVLTKQTRYDKAYYYQLFLAVSQTMESLSLSLLAFAFYLSGADTDGYPPFQRVYALMWYQAHLAIPLNQVAITTSLFLAISMSIDRLFALIRPIEYKMIDRRRHQYAALIGSIGVAVASSVYNGFLFELSRTEDGRYLAVFDVNFAGSSAGRVMTGLANFVRIFGLTCLVTCNLVLIRQFRKRSSKVAMLAVDSTDKKGRERRSKERTLISLTFCESTFCAIKQFSEVIFYTAAYYPNFPCYDDLLAPLLDMFLEIACCADVLAPFIVSRQLRSTARKLIQRPVDSQTTQNSKTYP